MGRIMISIVVIRRQCGMAVRLAALSAGLAAVLLVAGGCGQGTSSANGLTGTQINGQSRGEAAGLPGGSSNAAAAADSEAGGQPPSGQTVPPLDKERVARGQVIYNQYCVKCHGEKGVGENPSDPYATDPQGNYVAPPLDGSAHAWHHTDDDLVQFISDGSPRNPRMKAWKETLGQEEIRDVVEYIKSLWGPKELACQGPRHMDPGCFRGH